MSTFEPWKYSTTYYFPMILPHMTTTDLNDHLLSADLASAASIMNLHVAHITTMARNFRDQVVEPRESAYAQLAWHHANYGIVLPSMQLRPGHFFATSSQGQMTITDHAAGPVN